MLSLLLAATPTPLPLPAKALLAQAITIPAPVPVPDPGYPYVSLQMGAAFPKDYYGDTEVRGIVPVTSQFDLNGGFNGELALGYKWPRWRTELAVGYTDLPVESLNFLIRDERVQRTGTNGSGGLTTVMLNGYYDIPILNSAGVQSRWSPYLGAGVGYANISMPACDFGSGCFGNSGGSALAYQAKAGVAYRASERGFAFVEGGYLGAGTSGYGGLDFDAFGAWRVNVGWRQGFGGAPRSGAVAVQAQPPAEPAPMAAPIEEQPAPAPVLQPGPVIRGLW